jgi:hypothetical protein
MATRCSRCPTGPQQEIVFTAVVCSNSGHIHAFLFCEVRRGEQISTAAFSAHHALRAWQRLVGIQGGAFDP